MKENQVKTTNKIILITSLLILFLHLFISFVQNTIVASPLLIVGLFGISYNCLFYLISAFSRIANRSDKTYKVSDGLISMVCAIIMIYGLSMDFVLRYGSNKEHYQSYTERNGNLFYTSGYRFHNIWKSKYNYLPGKAFSKKIDKKSEFEIEYSYNNLGFRNDGFNILPKSEDEYRILALGDSWTEGVGAKDGGTWTAFLQRLLLKVYSNITVINAGKSGSDPIYSLYTLEQVYDELQPDLVVLAINTSDISDIIIGGGKQRFDNKDKVALKVGPWWEFFYAASFSIRRYVKDDLDYENILIRKNELESEFLKAAETIYYTILDIHNYCHQMKMELAVVFIPNLGIIEELRKGIISKEWYVMKNLHSNIENIQNLTSIDLSECYLNRIEGNLTKYWWENDYHHTSEGYNLMAECIFEEIFD
ncbi:MAG: GDSL-type esterase/lipase family protein [Chitinophagales bacterium]